MTDAPNIDVGRTVAAMDVLALGIGEIVGGSQREERPDVLDRSMAERGIDREHYAWYRDLRRYGTVPQAGFGDYGDGLLNRRRRWRFGRSPAPPAGASLISLSTHWGSRDRCGGNCGLTIAGTGPQFFLSRRRSASYYLIP
jgi:hypothetical protein